MVRLSLSRERLLNWVRNVGVALACVAGVVFSLQQLDEHYAVREWLVWQLLPVWGYTLLFNAACVAGGAAALSVLLGKRRLPPLEWLLYSMMSGLVLFVVALNVAGYLCAFDHWLALLLPLTFLAATFRAMPSIRAGLAGFRDDSPRSLAGRIVSFLAAGFGAACLVFMYVEALDVSNVNFDATWYHFPIAQDYARIGCIVPFPGEHHRAFPHLTSMVHTWALLVPGLEPRALSTMLSLHLEYSIVVWRIVGVAAAASYLLDGRRVRGLWAVFFLFPSIFVYDQNIGGSADHFLGFFAAPILLSAARFLRAFQWRWGVLLGTAMAGHVLTKYQAVYLLVALTVVCLVRFGYLLVRHALRRNAPRAQKQRRLKRLLIGPALAITAALAVSSPHWAKNIAFYNNPVYPYGRSVFTHSDPAPKPGYYRETPRKSDFPPKYSGLRRQLWALENLYTYSFTTRNRGFTDRRPYMGALFSLLLPCVLFVRRPRRIWLSVAIGAVAMMVWINTAPNDRYLLSFYDIFIAAAAALTVRVWELGWLARAALVPLVGLQLFWGGDAMIFYGSKRLRQATSLIEQGYAGKKIDSRLTANHAQLRITAATPPNAVILARNYKTLLGLDRMVLSDIRDMQFYISYSGVRDEHELWRLLHERGVTHLLYPEGRRPPVRLNNTVLFAELFEHHARNVKSIGGVNLGEMPPQAPPPSAPYLVLVKGLRSYPDGVYRVEQLDVDDRNPKGFSPPPKPERRFADREDVLEGVRAVALGPGGRLGSEAQSRLNSEFTQVERFKNYTLYLQGASADKKPERAPKREPVPEPVDSSDDDDDDDD
jgi:hypothetical protein